MSFKPKNILQEIESEHAFIWLRQDKIVHVHFKPFTTFDIDLQLAMRRGYAELEVNLPANFIFSADEGFTLTKEARENFSNLGTFNPIKAYALVIRNLPQRLIANFFLKVYKPAIKVRTFLSVEDAAHWLNSLD